MGKLDGDVRHRSGDLAAIAKSRADLARRLEEAQARDQASLLREVRHVFVCLAADGRTCCP